jgi:hypothetical protein
MLDVRARPPAGCGFEPGGRAPGYGEAKELENISPGAITPASDAWERVVWLLCSIAEISSSKLPIPAIRAQATS